MNLYSHNRNAALSNEHQSITHNDIKRVYAVYALHVRSPGTNELS